MNYDLHETWWVMRERKRTINEVAGFFAVPA